MKPASKESLSVSKPVCELAFFFLFNHETYHLWKSKAYIYNALTGQLMLN